MSASRDARAIAAIGAALLVGAAAGRLTKSSAVAPLAPSVRAPTAQVVASVAASTSASAAPATSLERATAGDLDALKRLEEDGKAPSASAAIAIARGHAALALADLRALDARVKVEPALAADRVTLSRAWDFVEREPLALDALPILATWPGPDACDLVHAVWRRHRSTIVGLLARDLLRGAMRDRASPALRVAIDLEELTEEPPAEGARARRRCERALATLAVAVDVGDRRLAPQLEALDDRRSCGGDAQADCFPCLRDDGALARARDTAKKREPPTPWLLGARGRLARLGQRSGDAQQRKPVE